MGRINQLAEKTTLNSTDVIAVDAGAGGNTNKMTGANLAGQLKALGNYQDKLTFDTTPTAGSTNPVTSGGVKTALDGKQNTLAFDTTPTAGSTNPVTSGGIANAIQQSTATGGVGYFKSPDGTLIQWGTIEGAKSGDSISYAIPYVGNTPSITITPYYNSITTIRCILVANPQPSQTAFILYAYDTSTGAVSTSTTLQGRWIAAGCWKN